MDLSKEYILMCEKAVEIQNKWGWDTGDFYYAKYGIYTSTLDKNYAGVGKRDVEDRNRDEYVWLPRQDQLQGILEYSFDRLHQLAHIFYESSYQKDYTFTTLEQMWLTIVMAIKYNKSWNGTDWA